MYRMGICDDDDAIAVKIKKILIEDARDRELDIAVDLYHDGGELLNAFTSLEYDAVFLDIEMNTVNGNIVAEALWNANKKAIIIVVSNHDEMVYSLLKFQIHRFIRKSYLELEINEALASLYEELKKKNHSIYFQTDIGSVSLTTEDIVYFEVFGHDVFCVTNKVKHKVRESLNRLEERLAERGFIRTHRSYLVNYRYIYSVDKSSLILTTQEEILLSKYRSNDVKQKLVLFSR